MASSPSSDVDIRTSPSGNSSLATSPASSPPPAEAKTPTKMAITSIFTEQQMLTEEKKARAENTRAEAKRLAARRKRKKIDLSPHDKAPKAKELDELLRKSKVFSDILTQKTKALGRVGRDFGNQALADAGIELKKQPKIMSGGTMRDYQLEGLTWMYEICLQGMSGILADEMGLG